MHVKKRGKGRLATEQLCSYSYEGQAHHKTLHRKHTMLTNGLQQPLPPGSAKAVRRD